MPIPRRLDRTVTRRRGLDRSGRPRDGVAVLDASDAAAAAGSGQVGRPTGIDDLPRVRSVPVCSGPIDGVSGSRSCTAERISTRLIESIPRSASSRMSSSSISTGYPVFSATASSRIARDRRRPARSSRSGDRVARPRSRPSVGSTGSPIRPGSRRSRGGSRGSRSARACRRHLGEPLLEGREDLDPLDRVDPQVGVEPHVELEHLGRIPGLLGDRLQQDPGEIAFAGPRRAGELAAGVGRRRRAIGRAWPRNSAMARSVRNEPS